MTEPEKKRRASLLSILAFYPCLTVSALRREMEEVHGLAVSADLVRADLSWLAEMGLALVNDDAAQVSERGRDVATRRAKFPGE